MLDQTERREQASGYFWVCWATGDARCANSNLVTNRHTKVVAGSDLITIAINHGTMELVMDLDRLADVDNYKRVQWVFSDGATTDLGAPEATFLATATRGDCPDW